MLFDLPPLVDTIGLAITCVFSIVLLASGKDLLTIVSLIVQILLFW